MIRFVAIVTLIALAGCASFKNVDNAQFNIATFNIRVPADKGNNAIDKRIPRIVEVIKNNNFDVFGVQEAVPYSTKALDKALTNYARLGVGRNSNCFGESCPIYYNRDRFECISSRQFWLSQTPMISGSIYKGAGCPRVCVAAKFKDKITGRTFNFINTHLDHKSSSARMNGVNVIRDEVLNDLLRSGQTTFLCGDLNCNLPNEKPDTLKTIKPEALMELSKTNPIALLASILVDTYSVSEAPHIGTDGTYHAYGSVKSYYRIDYMFATKDVRVLSHKTVNDRPDGKFPSDHDAVVVRVEL